MEPRQATNPTLARSRLAALVLLALAVAAGGCGSARVMRSRAAIAAERASGFASARVPGPITAEVLDRNGHGSPIGLVNPARAADRLVASGAARSDPDGPLALADLRVKAARRAEVYGRSKAPGLFYDAIEAASAALGTPPKGRSEEEVAARQSEATRIYNDAVAGFLRCTAGSRMRLDDSWRAAVAKQGIEVRVSHGPMAWSPDWFSHFYFSGDYRVFGIREPKREQGVGVPLIAERRPPAFGQGDAPRGEERFYPRQLQAYPATVVLRPGREDGGRVLTVDLIDPMRADAIEFAGADRPLGSDLTTPLAFYFTSLPLPKITQVGLLRPGVLEKQTGLYLLHPYEPGKIPVVLVHGLWSSPDTWHQALDELRGDPELRDRYQFWVYFYPTGDPFLYSATKLRQALAEVRETLDPTHADPAFDQMVMVGHSMGGLLSRLMVVDSGTTFWDSIANRPFGELKSGPGQRELVSKVFFFEANPSIKRVVYIATPHRGSTLSGALIGRMSNALIRLPGMFEETERDLISANDDGFFKEEHTVGPATSITQLSPRSAALTALNVRPMAPGVPYHSIIAKSGSGPLETSSDLIVHYESAHLDGAASERVVSGTHACLGKPETIEEIRRILALHLRETDGLATRE